MEQSKKKVWLSVIAIALLCFAGYRMFIQPSDVVAYPDEFTGQGVCLNCQQEVTFSYKAMTKPPYVCQGCGEQAVYLWWYCDDCSHRFVPNLVRKEGEPPRPNPYPYCTHCRCMNITAWDPENPYQSPMGDAKLPEWP